MCMVPQIGATDSPRYGGRVMSRYEPPPIDPLQEKRNRRAQRAWEEYNDPIAAERRRITRLFQEEHWKEQVEELKGSRILNPEDVARYGPRSAFLSNKDYLSGLKEVSRDELPVIYRFLDGVEGLRFFTDPSGKSTRIKIVHPWKNSLTIGGLPVKRDTVGTAGLRNVLGQEIPGLSEKDTKTGGLADPAQQKGPNVRMKKSLQISPKAGGLGINSGTGLNIFN